MGHPSKNMEDSGAKGDVVSGGPNLEVSMGKNIISWLTAILVISLQRLRTPFVLVLKICLRPN